MDGQRVVNLKGVDRKNNWPTLRHFPLPAKVLVTAILLTMAVGMAGAMAQIVVHDVIPTFFGSNPGPETSELIQTDQKTDARGDLFENPAAGSAEKAQEPVYKSEQFVWTLKWTHIHLFGMSTIFILMGAIVVFFDMRTGARTLLIALPFLGIWIDIASMWLKGYISPDFFWLHIPGGGLFGAIFIFVFFRGIFEMWVKWPTSFVK